MKCRPIGDRYFSLADPMIDCDSDIYKNTVFPLSLVIVLCVVMFLPLILGLILFKEYKNKNLNRL